MTRETKWEIVAMALVLALLVLAIRANAQEPCEGYDSDVYVTHGKNVTWCWEPATGGPDGYQVHRDGALVATVQVAEFTYPCGNDYEKVEFMVSAVRGGEIGPPSEMGFSAECAVDTDFDDSGITNSTDFLRFFMPAFNGKPQL